MKQNSLKNKLKESYIISAELYKNLFIDNEYLITSSSFQNRDYYIIYGNRDNFLHLTGVHSKLKSAEFFDRAIYGTLTEHDFDFSNPYMNTRDVIGCAKKKAKALLKLESLFQGEIETKESFQKGRIKADLALSNQFLTLLFVAPDRARPKSMLGGNMIKNGGKIDLVLRRKRGEEFFSELIIGSDEKLDEYRPLIGYKLTSL
ncbi:MAG: hypothetical protein K6G51_08260 [Sphaerochaetaceae bacterium]|nr:hypothetical protein [Sphaerochaetaceae bacterium]